MKIIITGHTSGIGQAIYDHFKLDPSNEVIGLSRTTGYDIPNSIDAIIKVSSGCDLFINNTCVENSQLELLLGLYDKVGKMIVLGSRMGDYSDIFNTEYSHIKKQLKEKCHDLSLLPDVNILYVNISMLEDAKGMERLIPFNKVVDLIDFWIQDSMLTSATFEIKMTDSNLDSIENKFQVTHFRDLIKNGTQRS